MAYLVLTLVAYLIPVPFVWRRVARNYVNVEVKRCSTTYPATWSRPSERQRLIGESRAGAVLPATIIAIGWPVTVPIAAFYHWVTESDILTSDFERREAAEAEVARLSGELDEARRMAAQSGLPFPDVDR